MKNYFLRMCKIIAILCVFLFSPQLGNTQEKLWSGNINFILGAKALEKDDWEPADEQTEFCIEGDFKKKDWPVSIAIDLSGAVGEGNVAGLTFESTTSEFNVGVRKIWDKSSNVRPFLGGGVSFMSAEIETLGVSIDGTGTGFWLGGGVYWTLGIINIGFEAKYSSAETELEKTGVDVESGGGHFGLLFGFHI